MFIKIIIIYCLSLNVYSYQIVKGGTTSTAINTSNMNLTDAQRQMIGTYQNQGYNTRECIKKAQGNADAIAICNGGQSSSGNIKVMGISESMIQTASQIYSMFTMFKGLNGNSSSSTDTASSTKKSSPDYCQYIPLAGEIIALGNQKKASAPIVAGQTTSSNQQADAFFNSAREHEVAAKSADSQSKVWGASALCYAGTGAYAGVSSLDTKYYLKLAGTSFMAYFYAQVSSKHKGIARQFRTLGMALPKAGACNPITNVTCYCSQPETLNDPNYCTPQAQLKLGNAPVYKTTCVNSQIQKDPNCNCLRNNSCIGSKLTASFKSTLAGSGFVQSPAGNQTLQYLNSKRTTPASASGTAMATGAIKKLDLSKIKASSLNHAQKKIAQMFKKIGMPAMLAGMAASQISKRKSSHLKKFRNISNFNGYTGNYSSGKLKNRKRNNVLQYSRMKQQFNKSRHASSFSNPFLSKIGQKKASRAKGKVLNYNYMQQAKRAAEINKDTSKPIFDIISRRYHLSAWNVLNWQN